MRPAAATLRGWRENPVAFAYENCQFEGDKKQREYLSLLPSQDEDKKRISLQACTGSGKTAVGAIGLLNFISCYGTPTEHPRGLVSSITGANLFGNMWPALSEWQQRSEFLKRTFEWTKTRFSSREFPQTWFLEARPWSRKANAEEQGRTFSGLHAPFVTVFLDESGDIPVPVLRSAEQIFSTRYRYAKVCQSGNPTSLNNALHHAATTARALWRVIRMTADPDDPDRSERADLANARQMIELYGRENPWVMATILGQFPPSSINSLLGIDDVLAAMNRTLPPREYRWAQKRLGVDVAFEGDDRSVGFPRQGRMVPSAPWVMRSVQESAPIAARILRTCERWSPELILIDNSFHWGEGVSEHLRIAGLSPMGIKFDRPGADDRYANIRAEMNFRAADWVRQGGCLPPNLPELVAEATAPTYTSRAGKLIIEPKPLIKKRLGRSPDIWDAFCLTFALPEIAPQSVGRAAPANRKAREEAHYDPLELEPVGHQREDYDPFR